jgi:hypothetical protein
MLNADDRGRWYQDFFSCHLNLKPLVLFNTVGQPSQLGNELRSRITGFDITAWSLFLLFHFDILSSKGLQIGSIRLPCLLLLNIHPQLFEQMLYHLAESYKEGVFKKSKEGRERLVDIPDCLAAELEDHTHFMPNLALVEAWTFPFKAEPCAFQRLDGGCMAC